MPEPYTMDELKRLVAPVARKHGVAKVSVFGSYGRNEATRQSDVDLHIEKGTMRTLLEMIAFQQDMEEALQISVDVVTSDIPDRAFLRRIRQEEAVLYEQ